MLGADRQNDGGTALTSWSRHEMNSVISPPGLEG